MYLLRILFITATADLLIKFTSAEDCDPESNAENWCKLSPPSRTLLEVSKNQPGRITCTIPPNGLDIWIVNQFGERVRRDATLQQHVTHTSTAINPTNKSFELEIRWPKDSEIQERLKILQCIAFFYQAKYPCRTSLVNIQFTKEEDATTTSTEASITTKELDTEEEKVTTTVAIADTTKTKTDNNQQTDAEKQDSPTIVERRSVKRSNARIANLRSIGQSDIYNNSANLSPNVFLLLLFALCLIIRY